MYLLLINSWQSMESWYSLLIWALTTPYSQSIYFTQETFRSSSTGVNDRGVPGREGSFYGMAQSAPHRGREVQSLRMVKRKEKERKYTLDLTLQPLGGNPCFWFGWAPAKTTRVVCMLLSWQLNVPGRFISDFPSMTVHLTLLNGKLFRICWTHTWAWGSATCYLFAISHFKFLCN